MQGIPCCLASDIVFCALLAPPSRDNPLVAQTPEGTDPVRLLHTSDWHIGKVFHFMDKAALAVLQNERLDAVTRLGRLALEQGASDVLVAGDIYDVETPAERTLRQPVERMRQFAALRWHLIPGNHDAHAYGGPWERLLRAGLPDNVHLHLSPGPVPLVGGEAWLLPAPLTRRHAASDSTEAMDAMPTPAGAARIGLAHGSVRAFGSDEASTHNLIAWERAERAGLAYLALGDWHGVQAMGERAWYSGTPEVDDFGVGGAGGGEALVVELDGPCALPRVTRHRVGRFAWHRFDAALHGAADVEVLEAQLRALRPSPEAVLLHLTVQGALSLAEQAAFEGRICRGVGSALFVLRLDDAGLLPRPTAADLGAFGPAGPVRVAADRLAARAADPADPAAALAAAALQRLYVLDANA